jgi:hypothetical protein
MKAVGVRRRGKSSANTGRVRKRAGGTYVAQAAGKRQTETQQQVMMSGRGRGEMESRALMVVLEELGRLILGHS